MILPLFSGIPRAPLFSRELPGVHSIAVRAAPSPSLGEGTR